MMVDLKNAIDRLLSYIERELYRGYDPYDALLSPLFDTPTIKKNKTIRFYAQQLVKRSPINLRSLLRIPKGYNPVTLGLCIQSYSRLMEIYPESRELLQNKAAKLVTELKVLIPNGFSGACWGYDFPWQARYADIPAYQPTVVATGIITNGLFQFYKTSGDKEAIELCKSAANFIFNDLKRSYDGSTFCFSYSPFDTQQVYNASAKAVRLLAQVYSVTKNEELLTPIRNASEYIINRQRADGSWHYSEVGKWIDNYHTGYVLDCLDECQNYTGYSAYNSAIELGVNYYITHFFSSKGLPKVYPDKNFPVDSTAAGQSLLTLSRFNKYEQAIQVANWMTRHMQSHKGYFYYRYNGLVKNRTSFMRWNNAWMLAGLSELLYSIKMKSKL